MICAYTCMSYVYNDTDAPSDIQNNKNNNNNIRRHKSENAINVSSFAFVYLA